MEYGVYFASVAQCHKFNDAGEYEYLRLRPGKVALSSGWKSRPGKVGRRRVASPWREGSNPRLYA